jgi:hypothetical protein
MLGADTFSELITLNANVYLTEYIWYPLLIMLIQGILYMVLVLVLDNLKFSLKDRGTIEWEEENFKKTDDLIKEKEKIKNNIEVQPIIVDNLYKKYPNGFVAVRDNSFMIEKG